ncbi:MAG: methylated-DNA--[protein]-cysteine S-methyltransferase [Polyangiaceae bacterium]|nr:methylated-DNA--[protein]-cysteine S-methyltransferase [Polyangiaceae bacterium]
MQKTEIQTPWGVLGVAESQGRVFATAWGGWRARPALEKLLKERGFSVLDSGFPQPSRGVVAQQLDAYLNNAAPRPQFQVDDGLMTTPFQRAVLSALQKTLDGEVLSYGELARRAGFPGAAQAVGSAMRRNPCPVVLPCHRVLPASGQLGVYTGGVDKKAGLLALEGWTAFGSELRR